MIFNGSKVFEERQRLFFECLVKRLTKNNTFYEKTLNSEILWCEKFKFKPHIKYQIILLWKYLEVEWLLFQSSDFSFLSLIFCLLVLWPFPRGNASKNLTWTFLWQIKSTSDTIKPSTHYIKELWWKLAKSSPLPVILSCLSSLFKNMRKLWWNS